MENVRVDLHNHLGRGGYFTSFNNVIDFASKRLGKEGVFAVANCSDKRYERFVNSSGYGRVNLGKIGVYVPDKRVVVVKAQEVETRDGDLLVLCGEGSIKDGMSLEDSLKASADNGGINVGVHPFYKSGIGKTLLQNPNLIGSFHGMEVYNSQAEFWLPLILSKREKYANNQAHNFYLHFCSNQGIGMLSFSDGHNEREIGICYTLIPRLNICDLGPSLRSSLKSVKSEGMLVKNPNILGAIKHAFNLRVTNKLFPRKG